MEESGLDKISIILKNGKQITFDVEDGEVVDFESDYLTIGDPMVAQDDANYEPRVKLKTKDIAGYGKNLTGV